MKKIIAGLLISFLVMGFMAGCGSPNDDVSSENSTGNNTSNSEKSKSSTKEELGSRLNPVPFGEKFTTTYTRNDQEKSVTIKLTDLMRGEEAKKLVSQKSDYNKDEISGDKEIMISRLLLTCCNHGKHLVESHTYRHIYTQTYTYRHIHTYKYMHANTHIQTHIHTHTHTQ